MSENNLFISEARTWLRWRSWVGQGWLFAGAVLLALAVVGTGISAVATSETAKHNRVSGAGKTIIEGGTGGAAPLPVTTLVAFHADAEGGDFECLALAPSAATGSGSGDFNVNAMYVTGKVTSLKISHGMATLQGTATVTGLGAGQDLPFKVLVQAGGPGATVKLDVSGLTFLEILVEGHISIDGERRD